MTKDEQRQQYERFMAAAITGLCQGLKPAAVDAHGQRLVGAAAILAGHACNDVNGRNWASMEGGIE